MSLSNTQRLFEVDSVCRKIAMHSHTIWLQNSLWRLLVHFLDSGQEHILNIPVFAGCFVLFVEYLIVPADRQTMCRRNGQGVRGRSTMTVSTSQGRRHRAHGH